MTEAAPLSPLIVSTWQRLGGAAIAAERLHIALRSHGIASRMLVTDNVEADKEIVGARATRRFSHKVSRTLGIRADPHLRPEGSDNWNNALHGLVDAPRLAQLGPSPLHIHWTAYEILSIESLAAYRGPIVWTLHDQWPFTGGCHYSGQCEGWSRACGNCPVLKSDCGVDMSSVNLIRKRRVVARDRRAVVVSPSRWLTSLAERSAVFEGIECVTIANPLDTTLFGNRSQRDCRARFGLPLDGVVLLFGAQQPDQQRKGFDLLADAVHAVRDELLALNVSVAVFGAASTALKSLGLPTYALGTISDPNTLADAYAACDVFAAPAREDNLPNTIVEAAAAGVPTVAFDVGGIKDIVLDGTTGALVPAFDVAKYAGALVALVQSQPLREALGRAARQHVSELCSPSAAVAAYEKVYRQVLL